MSSLYEVEVKNRVVKGFKLKPIRGTQGNWYSERLYFLADSEEEARNFAEEQLKNRRMIGVSIRRSRKYLRREIKITDVRRIA